MVVPYLWHPGPNPKESLASPIAKDRIRRTGESKFGECELSRDEEPCFLQSAKDESLPRCNVDELGFGGGEGEGTEGIYGEYGVWIWNEK